MGSVHFTLLTPTFSAGVDQTKPELRVPSIKGQLRWWTRALLGNGKPEYDLFGGIKGKQNGYPRDDAVAGSFIFRLLAPTHLTLSRLPLCPHDPVGKGPREALEPSQSKVFELSWFPRTAKHGEDESRELEKVIQAWLLLGAVGCRSNRTAGSVWPAHCAPTIDQFADMMKSLSLPTTLAVKVLASATSLPTGTMIPSYQTIPGNGYRRFESRNVAPSDDPETLRSIATDTVNGCADQLGTTTGMRKASPLKLKVGRFTIGGEIAHRLIAVWDARLGRGHNLSAAEMALSNANKPLGFLLAQPGEKLFQDPSLDP